MLNWIAKKSERGLTETDAFIRIVCQQLPSAAFVCIDVLQNKRV